MSSQALSESSDAEEVMYPDLPVTCATYCDGTGQLGLFSARGSGSCSAGPQRRGSSSSSDDSETHADLLGPGAGVFGALSALWSGAKDPPGLFYPPERVVLNVYFMRRVSLDERGRMQRSSEGAGGFGWGQQLFRSVLGVFHVGVELHGVEYTFGNYHAPQSQQLGTGHSGVFSHRPRRPGPHCLFKEAVELGNTAIAAAGVAEIAEQFGLEAFAQIKYDKIRNNCVDFAECFSAELGVSRPPSWCSRGARLARLLDLDRKLDLASCRPRASGNELAFSSEGAAWADTLLPSDSSPRCGV